MLTNLESNVAPKALAARAMLTERKGAGWHATAIDPYTFALIRSSGVVSKKLRSAVAKEAAHSGLTIGIRTLPLSLVFQRAWGIVQVLRMDGH